jgi:hypothetical protein
LHGKLPSPASYGTVDRTFSPEVSRQNGKSFGIGRDKIQKIFLEKGVIIDFIPELEDKDSFGDLDILHSNIEMLSIIKELFSPNEIVINGEVISFDYENFQIDMIKCENLEFCKFYFSYGDFGNLIGKIVKKYEYTFGHHCLSLIFENTKIILTTDTIEFCKFINIEYEKWKSIKTKDDLFELVKSCRFFRKEIFNSGNHEHRRCLSNRPLYVEFIKSIGVEEDSREETLQLTNEDKEGFIEDAINFFNKKEEIDHIKMKIERNKIINSKFNGNMLKERGFSGQQIGKIIKAMKETHSDFDNWVYESSEDEIMKSLENVISSNN